jgi:hypothetical protein
LKLIAIIRNIFQKKRSIYFINQGSSVKPVATLPRHSTHFTGAHLGVGGTIGKLHHQDKVDVKKKKVFFKKLLHTKTKVVSLQCAL